MQKLTITDNDEKMLIAQFDHAKWNTLGRVTKVHINQDRMVVHGVEGEVTITAATCGAEAEGSQLAYAILSELGLGRTYMGEAPIWEVLADRPEVTIYATFTGPLVRARNS